MAPSLLTNHKPHTTADWGLWLSKSALVLAAAALLVLLGASWGQQAGGAPVAYRLHQQGNRGCGDLVPTGASLTVTKQTASIVVVVTTKAGSWDRRKWLRDHFHKNVEMLRQQDPAAADGVVLRFAVGNIGLSEKGLNWIAAEQQEHGDLLVLNIPDINTPDPPPDGVETATSLKVVHSVNWAIQQYDFPWFVRLGDDSYFRVDHFLLNVAPTLSKDKLVFGYAEDPQLGWSFGHGVSITRYASGMGFIMTHDVAQYISDNAAVLYKGYPEDAVVGLWLAGTSFKVQHDARLHDWEWKRCSDQSIIIHKHDYGVVDDDGVMRPCFPLNITVTEASSHHHPDGSSDGEMPPVS